MPTETTEEFSLRHAKAGPAVRVNSETWLFGDGAQLRAGWAGGRANHIEPPPNETKQQEFVCEYWRLRVQLAETFFQELKARMLGESFNTPKWRPEFWGPEPEAKGAKALAIVRDLVARERKRLEATEEAYSQLPTVRRQREAEEAREEIARQRTDAERQRRATISAITI